ncbi:hypothetical protein D3C77_732680 [compost metagenome]
MLVAHNLTGSEQVIELSNDSEQYKFQAILKSTTEGSKLDGTKLTIPAYTTVILE